MTNHIKIISYNPKWPDQFSYEAKLIQKALGTNCMAVHHIGSTAVPGLHAKPIIDILVVVKDLHAIDPKNMESLGYQTKGEYGIAFRRYFQKIQSYNVHVFEVGDPEIDRYLHFRDWIRSHDEDAKEYATLKLELAAKFPNDILQYCNGKDAFVAAIDAKDGYEGWRMVQALTNREWSTVHYLRNTYFFTSHPDPYTSTFNLKDHIHFVFYKNVDIIGYCHLQLWPEKRAALRIIVIDEPFRKKGYGAQFLNLCEKWLKQEGYAVLLTQSSPNAYPFYCRQGYTKMPFNDPDGSETHPQDIELGKQLR